MSKAVESIVRGYVQLNNRKALEDLLAHRQKLLHELDQVSGIDANLLLTAIREEIAVIQTGLDRLDGKTAEALEDDRVKVLRLTVSESPSSAGNDSLATKPAAGAGDQLVQRAAHQPDLDAASDQGREQDSTEIKVLGLEVSVSSPGPTVAPRSVPSGSVGGLDPGSFTLWARASNEPTQHVEEGKETEAPHSAINAFRSLVSFRKDEPTKP